MADPARVEFARRRAQLMRLMGAGSIAILPAAPVRQRNSDVEYNFRQDSDFYYLSGFPEPEAVAVLIPGRAAGQYILFTRERNPERETWEGRRAGPAGATAEYGADDAFPISDIDEILPGLLEGRERVFYTMGLSPEFDQHVISWVNTLRAQARSGPHPPHCAFPVVATFPSHLHQRKDHESQRGAYPECHQDPDIVHDYLRDPGLASASSWIEDTGFRACSESAKP